MKTQPRNSPSKSRTLHKTPKVISQISRTAKGGKKALTQALPLKGDKKMETAKKSAASAMTVGSTAMRVGRYAILAGGAYLLWRQRGRISSIFGRGKAAVEGAEENVSMSADKPEHTEGKEFTLSDQKPGDFRKRDKFEQNSNKQKPGLTTVQKDQSSQSQAV
jgi:hypothetical protein